MEYKKTTYEIIELFPNILRHKIPLIQIMMGTTYYATFPFIFSYMLYKKGLELFSKIEISKGAEDNLLVSYFDLKTLENIELEKDDVLLTESAYYSIKESILLGEELEEKGYSISENVGKKYRIKKREETIVCIEEHPDEEIVIISVPITAIYIHNFFDMIKLL